MPSDTQLLEFLLNNGFQIWTKFQKKHYLDKEYVKCYFCGKKLINSHYHGLTSIIAGVSYVSKREAINNAYIEKCKKNK